MARVPGFAKAFAGRWRIVEMDNWDSDFLDLVEEAHLTFAGTIQASFANAAEFFNSLLVLLSQKKRLIQKVAGEVLSESVTG
jgi:hypothetical protein